MQIRHNDALCRYIINWRENRGQVFRQGIGAASSPTMNN